MATNNATNTSNPITVAQGGTGDATITGVLTGNGTGVITGNAVTQFAPVVGGASNAVGSIAVGSAGQVLQSGGNAANPVYSTATFPSTATSTGTILRADGTNWSATTATYPATTTINQILYSSAANTISGLATANSAVLATNSSGVPSITATPRVTSITFDGTNNLGNFVDKTSWTPVLAFGGGSTNITYTTQTGLYSRIGNMVCVSMIIILSNKGISTGAVSITGFPLATENNNSYPLSGRFSLLTFTGQVFFRMTNNTIFIDASATTGANTQLTDTAFVNTTILQCAGIIMV